MRTVLKKRYEMEILAQQYGIIHTDCWEKSIAYGIPQNPAPCQSADAVQQHRNSRRDQQEQTKSTRVHSEKAELSTFCF